MQLPNQMNCHTKKQIYETHYLALLFTNIPTRLINQLWYILCLSRSIMTFYSENISLPPSETCFNCMKSNDGDSVKLSRCSKCKIAFYCSTLCMKEHWYKVHGKHCKYLAGDEKMVDADHEEKKCKVCKDMSRKPHKYRGTVVQCPFKIKKDSLFKNATKTISRVLLHQLQNGWDITVLEDEFANQPANFLINLPFQLG